MPYFVINSENTEKGGNILPDQTCLSWDILK